MKTLFIGFFVAFIAQPMAAHAVDTMQLQGSWTLKSAVYTKADGSKINISAQDLQSIKVLSKQHFSFVTADKNGNFSSALAGSYQIKGDSYQETPESGSVPAMLHKTYHFKARLEGKLWFHSGMEDGVKIEEVWQRLD